MSAVLTMLAATWPVWLLVLGAIIVAVVLMDRYESSMGRVEFINPHGCEMGPLVGSGPNVGMRYCYSHLMHHPTYE